MKVISRPLILAILSVSMFNSPLRGGVLLSEISGGGSSDWIEVMLAPGSEPMDISFLFVTMYYGTNEKLADSPVTLYAEDRPATAWDDRFAVIRFVSSSQEDETDITGDINGNGIRDIYCVNYGLWNTDCCVAIDSNDDPADNGMLDFMAFSNRDGSINSTIASYINYAISHGMWQSCASPNLQDCCVFAGEEGMNSYSTISRTGTADTGSADNFILTPYATPGRDNIIGNGSDRGRVIKSLKDPIVYDYDRAGNSGIMELPLFLYSRASLRVRIFNASGMPVYCGPLLRDLDPGFYTASLNICDFRGGLRAGLYPVRIEAVDSDTGKTRSLAIKLIVVRKK